MANDDHEPFRFEDDDETLRRKILASLDSEQRSKMAQTVENPAYLAQVRERARRATTTGKWPTHPTGEQLLPQELINAAAALKRRDTMGRKQMERVLQSPKAIDDVVEQAVSNAPTVKTQTVSARPPAPDAVPPAEAPRSPRDVAALIAAAPVPPSERRVTDKMPTVADTRGQAPPEAVPAPLAPIFVDKGDLPSALRPKDAHEPLAPSAVEIGPAERSPRRPSGRGLYLLVPLGALLLLLLWRVLAPSHPPVVAPPAATSALASASPSAAEAPPPPSLAVTVMPPAPVITPTATATATASSKPHVPLKTPGTSKPGSDIW